MNFKKINKLITTLIFISLFACKSVDFLVAENISLEESIEYNKELNSIIDNNVSSRRGGGIFCGNNSFRLLNFWDSVVVSG